MLTAAVPATLPVLLHSLIQIKGHAIVAVYQALRLPRALMRLHAIPATAHHYLPQPLPSKC